MQRAPNQPIHPQSYSQPQQMQQPVLQQQFVQQPMMQQPQQVQAPGMFQNPAQGQPQVVYVNQQKSSSNGLAWVGVALIFISLFLPYISFLGVEVTGFEMIEIVGDIVDMDSSDSDGSDDSGGSDEDSADLPAEYMFFGIASLMLGLSPIVFLISAIISTLSLAAGGSPKVIGTLHIGYSVVFLIVAALGTIDLGILGSISVFDFTEFGFYIGAFASALLMIE